MLFIKRLGVAAALMAATATSIAAPYPAGPVKMIVPFGAGGITDIIARQLAQKMGQVLDETIVVENKAGAGGAIGAYQLSIAKPDGYTVFLGTVGTQVVNRLIMKELNYNPDEFVPVGMISGSPYVAAIRSTLGPKTMEEFVAFAKERPGEINFGSAGVGSSPQLGVELLKLTAGIDMVHVPFKSGGEAVNATAGDQTDLVMDAIPVVMPHVRSGKLIPLALAAENRSPAAPDVPTTAEAGQAEVKISSWNALYLPAGTPDDVVAVLQKALRKALADENFQNTLNNQGTEVYTGSETEYNDFITEERSKWKRIVKEAEISIQQ